MSQIKRTPIPGRKQLKPHSLQGDYAVGQYSMSPIHGYNHVDQGRKHLFLQDGRAYLRSVGEHLRSLGFTEQWVQIWPEWQERKDSHPVIYLRCLPFVAYWVAYEASNGAVPQGLAVVQACSEYRCVNPKHLTVGTAAPSGSDSEPEHGTRS